MPNVHIIITTHKIPIINSSILALPVTPSIITVNQPQGIRRDIIVNVGEVADIGNRKPKNVAFSSFFPEHFDTYVNAFRSHLSPSEWVNNFDILRGFYFPLVVTGLNVNGLYILGDFNYKQVGGVGGDIEYDVNFVQYRPVAIRNVNINEEFALEVSNVRNVVTSTQEEQSYRIRRYDTWSSIAARFGLTPNELRLYNNRINIFDLIVGDIIYIPSGGDISRIITADLQGLVAI